MPNTELLMQQIQAATQALSSLESNKIAADKEIEESKLGWIAESLASDWTKEELNQYVQLKVAQIYKKHGVSL